MEIQVIIRLSVYDNVHALDKGPRLIKICDHFYRAHAQRKSSTVEALLFNTQPHQKFVSKLYPLHYRRHIFFYGYYKKYYKLNMLQKHVGYI